MTTITSPRSQTPQVKSPTSSATPSARSSISVDRPQLQVATGSTRRNRSALRDYYKLPAPTPTTNVVPPTPQTPVSPGPATSAYDQPDFNAVDYVSGLLENEGLAKIMRTEAELLSDIRGLDGERKALVYDNYSKLIDATETIGRVREMLEVEALTGRKKEEADVVAKAIEGAKSSDVEGHGRLDELVGKVVEVAMRGRIEDVEDTRDQEKVSKEKEAKEHRARQKSTVRWVLDTPRRLETAVQEGRKAEAQKDWEEVQALLDRWQGVKGAAELKSRCEEVLAEG